MQARLLVGPWTGIYSESAIRVNVSIDAVYGTFHTSLPVPSDAALSGRVPIVLQVCDTSGTVAGLVCSTGDMRCALLILCWPTDFVQTQGPPVFSLPLPV